MYDQLTELAQQPRWLINIYSMVGLKQQLFLKALR